jgi:hypothetical protein
MEKDCNKINLMTKLELNAITLPAPRLDTGKSLAEALQVRQTIREISDQRLSMQLLSNLLWAAFGINRSDGPFGIPGRTAASASNSQEIYVYVVLPEATYLYDPVHHVLVPVAEGDFRKLSIGTGQEESVRHTPVSLVYVADLDKLANTSGYQEPGLKDPEVQKSYYFVDTGLIAGNVSLFAASEGLTAWFHNCNKKALTLTLKLGAEQRVLFGQTIGYPKTS